LVADEHVPPTRARTRMVLRNLADPSLLPPVTPPSEQPKMVYIGDVRTSRGLKSMLAALEQAPSWTLDVVGRVDPADQPWLSHWRATSPAAVRLTLHGQLPPALAWQHAQTAWVGLVLLQPTPAFLAAMPSKVYEYQACGLAVVTTNLPRQQAWLDSGGVGVSVAAGDDAAVAAAVAHALHGIERDPALVQGAREQAAQLRSDSPYAQFAAAVSGLCRT
ncbi:MAG: glycosyltransferase, partial [Actinomycetales bacterium]|nr:glycosyltransferase [Actinomycetales bacterium]